jgi:hypothetical protein
MMGATSARLNAEKPAATAPATGQAVTKRIYFVGNSVTDVVKYGLLADLAKSRGHAIVWGRHMIPGAPLFFMLNNALEGKPSGFIEEPFGDCVNALKQFEWDAISLQPFDRRLTEEQDKTDQPQGDIAVCQKFIDLALVKSPDVQIYLYARYPRCYLNGNGLDYDKDAFDRDIRGVSMSSSASKPTTKPAVDDYDIAWNTKYSDGWGMVLESRAYFEKLLEEVRKKNPNMKKPVLIIPVGYVMAELNTMMKAGKVPGYRDIHGVYADCIHLDNVGSYICACTFYATIFKESPKGLPADAFKIDNPKLVETIQETVWKVVSEHPLAGIKAQ